ncbi:MAG: hypothetical protein JWM80_4429 [Cyanobacteria bacterium RYN_339]|nr:hypothetical protein [Cyanobacteria bacterium RYN_339]
MVQSYALVEQLHLVCQDVLGRVPTPAELGAWRIRLAGGMTVAQVRTQLARSPEARILQLFVTLPFGKLTPELRLECLRQVRMGVSVEEAARYLDAKLAERAAIGWAPVPTSRSCPGSTGARGCRTRAPGFA